MERKLLGISLQNANENAIAGETKGVFVCKERHCWAVVWYYRSIRPTHTLPVCFTLSRSLSNTHTHTHTHTHIQKHTHVYYYILHNGRGVQAFKETFP